MSEPYLGQVVAVGFSFAPVGWALCDGSLLSISQNSALFSLIGTYYGGDGRTTFALPDLRGRAVIGQGQAPGLQTYMVGQAGGAETVTLAAGQFAAHTHAMAGAGSVSSGTPGTSVVFGTPPVGVQVYANSGGNSALSANTVGPAGGQNGPHENRQPFLTINYIIALQGAYPPRS